MDTAEQRVVRRAAAAAAVLTATLIMGLTCGNGPTHGHHGPAAPTRPTVRPTGTAEPPGDARARPAPTPYAS